jgi:hypothetical protein
MNANEPVAWTVCLDCGKRVTGDSIHTCSPQLKTLTDEEIEQVRVAIMGTAYWCADENMSEAYNAVKVCCGKVLAILRKAQEK